METLEATFKIITPMFLGGADQKPSDGIRPTTVKGALRFWWRALSWGKYRSGQGVDDESSLNEMHKDEARLFGLAAKLKNGRPIGGQGCFLLSVSQGVLSTTSQNAIHQGFKPKNNDRSNQGGNESQLAAARYLGYGIVVPFTTRDSETGQIQKRAGQLERGCLNENQQFTVRLIFRDKVEPSIESAVKVLGLFGGLGARSRHGMGSIALMSLKINDRESWTAPASESAYDNVVKELFSSSCPISSLTSEPPFTAFWDKSRVIRLLNKDNCYQALDSFGSAMLDYRSWGRSSKGNKLPSGKTSEQRFKDDHDWFQPPDGCRLPQDFHPERAVFGLPHNYDKDHHHVVPENHERRASPLLFHVHPIGKQFIGVAIYLPAMFLPAGEGIKANGIDVPTNIQWHVLTDFIDGRVGDTITTPKPNAPFRFPNKKQVMP